MNSFALFVYKFFKIIEIFAELARGPHDGETGKGAEDGSGEGAEAEAQRVPELDHAARQGVQGLPQRKQVEGFSNLVMYANLDFIMGGT